MASHPGKTRRVYECHEIVWREFRGNRKLVHYNWKNGMSSLWNAWRIWCKIALCIRSSAGPRHPSHTSFLVQKMSYCNMSNEPTINRLFGSKLWTPTLSRILQSDMAGKIMREDWKMSGWSVRIHVARIHVVAHHLQLSAGLVCWWLPM